MISRFACLALLTSLLIAQAAQAKIPSTPQAGQFLHDYANVLNEADRQRIAAFQKQAYEKVQVPLVVVTVDRMSTYDPGAQSIETFATKWFNSWGIGSKQKDDGILVIISIGDRKGRIELGGSWARRFDDYCQRIMDNEMIPQFKKGNYSGGLVNAVESLSVMAISGPDATPPAPSIIDKYRDNPFVEFASQENPIKKNYGTWPLVFMFLLGVGCLIAAIYYPDHRKALIITGIILIALAVIFWIVIMIVMMLLPAKRGGGGGGFGGGSSGGGGASGSW